MKFVHIIDSNGLFVEDAFVDELTELTIETLCPEGFYHPKWDGTQWVEGGTAPTSVQETPTESERITTLEDAMLAVILGGITNG